MKKAMVIIVLSLVCCVMAVNSEQSTALDFIQSCTVSVEDRV